ncbi:MAG TPA: HD domain-containing phosphohydrolase [Gemmatimonadaceae bacterium]|nr:HD domain-containing phosphohydrolase [Gemmatimonadaceae bacterium]
MFLPRALGTLVLVALYGQNRRERKITERLAAAALESLLNAIDANDEQTGAHVRRVATYSISLAEAAELDEPTVRSVERVALFHDIGKIHEAIMDIVREPTSLSPEERQLLTMHPQRGAEVLQPLAEFYPDLAAGVLAHHERWDGSGYPRGLRGKDIPLNARVVAIGDTFDAITHTRRYREGRSVDDAVRVIREGAGTQFDPRLARIFVSEPVLERVCMEARQALRPRASGKRHARGPGERAPDIKFRWRSESPVQHAPDLPH